jgi:hypothetical protein
MYSGDGNETSCGIQNSLLVQKSVLYTKEEKEDEENLTIQEFNELVSEGYFEDSEDSEEETNEEETNDVYYTINLKPPDVDDLFSNLSLGENTRTSTRPSIPQKLSPWEKDDGPILKDLPTKEEMKQMVRDGTCTCLLLFCKETVITRNIPLLSDVLTPLFFMCSKHKKEVTQKYH